MGDWTGDGYIPALHLARFRGLRLKSLQVAKKITFLQSFQILCLEQKICAALKKHLHLSPTKIFIPSFYFCSVKKNPQMHQLLHVHRGEGANPQAQLGKIHKSREKGVKITKLKKNQNVQKSTGIKTFGYKKKIHLQKMEKKIKRI